ncbi:DUF6338 family protein, partial [Pseudoalteromonas sp. MMG012]|uniref:DUF6338 family protein n=1 Tax=Pseudoalteromonas sp. MMG012 TaxID=2822686 RepID=UPI001B3A2180
MKLTYETLNLLLLLFPGLLSARIIGLIERKYEKGKFNIFLDVLIYSFISFVIVDTIYKWQPLFSVVKNIQGTYSYTYSADLKLIIVTLISAVAVPLIVGFVIHNDLHMHFLRTLKVTNKTSRDTAWDDVFTTSDRYITVNFKDDRRLTGWPMYYSNSPDEGFVYLCNSAW